MRGRAAAHTARSVLDGSEDFGEAPEKFPGTVSAIWQTRDSQGINAQLSAHGLLSNDRRGIACAWGRAWRDESGIRQSSFWIKLCSKSPKSHFVVTPSRPSNARAIFTKACWV